MRRYALHPGALQDLREIRAYIAPDSLDGTDRVIDEIAERIRMLAPFPQQEH